MKFIRNGMKWDTDKSKPLYQYGYETLYITPNNRLFIVDTYGCILKNTNQTETKDWLANRDVELYESLFGKLEEA